MYRITLKVKMTKEEDKKTRKNFWVVIGMILFALGMIFSNWFLFIGGMFMITIGGLTG